MKTSNQECKFVANTSNRHLSEIWAKDNWCGGNQVGIIGQLILLFLFLSFFFVTDTAATQIYTLSLHDALPISRKSVPVLTDCVWPFHIARPRAPWLCGLPRLPNQRLNILEASYRHRKFANKIKNVRTF